MTLNARTMSHQPGICRSIASSYGVTYGLPATGTDRLCDREHQTIACVTVSTKAHDAGSRDQPDRSHRVGLTGSEKR